MKIIQGSAHEWSDEELQRTLQSHLAPPTDTDYWSSLEERIMGRVRQEAAREWWSHFPGWVRLGVAAAAAAILVAGVASWQTRVAQERMAYRELFDASTDVPVLSERDVPVHREREQTLRYLLTH
ncbi:MAG: hypothetical protein IT361_01530 [Gemmatimonadaceae bacterium]|nr:hypothetical protein [Gemmatimonadaceae bacterium]